LTKLSIKETDIFPVCVGVTNTDVERHHRDQAAEFVDRVAGIAVEETGDLGQGRAAGVLVLALSLVTLRISA
jgi:hypothetical protein